MASVSELALVYNDTSVLENHHAAVTSGLIVKTGLLSKVPGKSERERERESSRESAAVENGRALRRRTTGRRRCFFSD